MAAKIIPTNYPSIQHLPHSKMRDSGDRYIDKREADWVTVKTKTAADVVIVTEKVDGCNVGVLRKGGTLNPISRKGYPISSAPYNWMRSFEEFVRDRRDRFMELLEDGERVCGEWMVKTHTLRYALPHEPFVAYDIIKGNTRDRYMHVCDRLCACDFVSAGLVHYGVAIPTEIAVSLMAEGFHGVIGSPEGVVYRYESAEHGWLFSAKYVCNPIVGDQELFKRNTESNLMNTWKHA